MEAAQALLEYEAEEDESITAALMRKELTAAIKDLKNGKATELPRLQEALDTLKETEDTLRELKKKLDQRQYDLEVKLALKKFGPEEETWEVHRLQEQAEKELAALGPEATAKAKRLPSDIVTLERRTETIRRLTVSIGGMITEPEAKALILQKHHDLVAEQMNRYLNAEKHGLLNVFENLWEKYFVCAANIESEKATVSEWLQSFLSKLGYAK